MAPRNRGQQGIIYDNPGVSYDNLVIYDKIVIAVFVGGPRGTKNWISWGDAIETTL